MTEERQNKIWAMLTDEEREDIRKVYAEDSGCYDFDEGYNTALETNFGKHNLTAQAGEKPKEDVETYANSQSGIYVSPSGEVIVRHDIDYQQYRLGLARELAVAMINSRFDDDVTECAVIYANEIVKRLKETEECNRG